MDAGLEIVASTNQIRSARDRMEHSVARFLLRLSPAWQRRLSGGSPIVKDGLTLDPGIQLMLRARELSGAPGGVTKSAPAQAREQMRRETRIHGGEPIEVGGVYDLGFDTPSGRLRARHYAPIAEGAIALQPLCVFFHGGGFVLGDLDTHDAPCRFLCKHARMHVLAIDYRLAPEHAFPAAVEDALEAFRFAFTHAEALGADPNCIGVAGDSAGGNLSAVVAQLTRDSGERTPDFAALLYPAVDRQTPYPSKTSLADGFLLTSEDIAFFDQHYFGDDPAVRTNPKLSPGLASDLRNLCPTLVVTAGFDPLRDEGEAYARALQAAGNRVIARREPGLIHGFLNMHSVSKACRAALAQIAKDLRELATGS
jgi:acetyl esterase